MKIFKNYFNIKQEIKELTEEAKQLEGEIFNLVVETENGQVVTDFAKFRALYKPKFEYSPELIEREKLIKQKIKIARKDEESSGKAQKINDGGQLRMTVVRKKE